MSSINHLLSRRDKHSHGNNKKEVHFSLSNAPSIIRVNKAILPLSIWCIMAAPLPPQNSANSSAGTSSIPFTTISLAFSRSRAKRSPRLQTTNETVECSSANAETFVLQPKQRDAPLNGLFIDDENIKAGRDEEKKVCPPFESGKTSSDRGIDQNNKAKTIESRNLCFQRHGHSLCFTHRIHKRRGRKSIRVTLTARGCRRGASTRL